MIFDHAMPYHKPKIPNQETQKAISDADAGKNLAKCKNLKALFNDLEQEDKV